MNREVRLPPPEPLLATAGPGLVRRGSLSEHRRGLLCVLGGVAALVPDATLLRLIHAPGPTAAAWRLALTGVVLCAGLACRHGTGVVALPRKLGRWGAAVSVGMSFSQVSFILAVKSTTVANVVLILATSSFYAALFSRAILGAELPHRTLLAMPVVFGGVAVAVGPGIVGDRLHSGDLWAMLTAVLGAARRTVTRAHAEVDMLPALALGNLLGSLGLAASGVALELGLEDLPPLLLLGTVCIPIASVLNNLGSRLLPSAESSMIMCLETVFSPILASVVLKERLPVEVWIGGAIVVAALVGHAAWPMLAEARSKR